MAGPLEPLQNLGRKMRELAESLGCDMDAFAFMPDLDGNNNIVQVVFVLPTPEEKPTHPELVGVDIDAEAARLLGDIEEYEAGEKRKAVDEEAIDRLMSTRDKLHGESTDGSSH